MGTATSCDDEFVTFFIKHSVPNYWVVSASDRSLATLTISIELKISQFLSLGSDEIPRTWLRVAEQPGGAASERNGMLFSTIRMYMSLDYVYGSSSCRVSRLVRSEPLFLHRLRGPLTSDFTRLDG